MFGNDVQRKEEGGDPGTMAAPCELCGLWEPMGGMHFMTRRETENLDRMRKVKAEIRALRQKPDSLAGREPVEAPRDLTRRLERLRALWREMEAEREAAREERMRLLGHAEG